MISLERQRREGESGELRNLLMVEREKSLQAAREAEKFSTEINIHKREAERAISDLERKRERVEELERLLLEAKVGKGREDTMAMFKWENKQQELEAKHKDELSSVQLRLANREADNYKMEQLMVKLHFSVDEARSEKEAAKTEAQMAVIAKVQAEEALKYAKQQYEELKVKALESEEECARVTKQK